VTARLSSEALDRGQAVIVQKTMPVLDRFIPVYSWRGQRHWPVLIHEDQLPTRAGWLPKWPTVTFVGSYKLRLVPNSVQGDTALYVRHEKLLAWLYQAWRHRAKRYLLFGSERV
jgi:hypothetical protein